MRRYTFPHINNFEEVLPAIQGVEEFFVKRIPESGILVVNYVYAASTTFPNPLDFEDPVEARNAAIRRECRGLKFDINTGAVVARPYHKFFNINEKPETQAHLIDWKQQHWILDKLDGSLITPLIRHDDRIEWHTKMGLTDVAKPVMRFIESSELSYEHFVRTMHEAGKTPIFEWCSRQQRIVIDYPSEALILTGIRNNVTGVYMDYQNMRTVAELHSIPCVNALASSVDNVQEFLERAGDLEGAEGYVVRFLDGHQYKVKGSWYCQIHGTKDTISREKDVWALILENRVDDVKPFMDETDRQEIEQFQADFENAISRYAQNLALQVIQAREQIGDNKKLFATEYATKLAANDRSMLFLIWDGKNPVEVVRNFLGKNVGTQPKLETVRPIVGLSWNQYHRNVVVIED